MITSFKDALSLTIGKHVHALNASRMTELREEVWVQIKNWLREYDVYHAGHIGHRQPGLDSYRFLRNGPNPRVPRSQSRDAITEWEKEP